MEELANKTALVTGSSRGIGAAIAKTFAANGALVILHGRDADALATVSREVHDAGGRTSICTADLINPAEIESMRLKIDAECGPVDILVANAGGSFARPGLIALPQLKRPSRSTPC